MSKNDKYTKLLEFIRTLYGNGAQIPLHVPCFAGNEKKYLEECIDTTMVSSVGPFVDRFEAMMREITGARYAIATTNGTAALHMAFILAGVKDGEEVITQPLTFVATCNAIVYERAIPVFVDVDRDTLGMSPQALKEFLEKNCERRGNLCVNSISGRRIAAVAPMHTFGHPVRITDIVDICSEWGLPVIEDAAESLGSYVKGLHTGTFGMIGAFSFNGNKTVTCGGGGCIVTNDEAIGKKAKYLTTTAKVPHPWSYFHDQVGYNYRLPNLNAALACAQLEQLNGFLKNKRETALAYAKFCRSEEINFISEPANCTSNYWLNAIVLDSLNERNSFLELAHSRGIMARPIWTLMNKLPMFSQAHQEHIDNAVWLEQRVVNLPSSYRR
jgi:perosamine synthetase